MSKAKSSCPICSEEKPKAVLVQIDGCSHRYCVPCMNKHVQRQLLNAVLPHCPAHDCKSQLPIETCQLFLPSNLLLIMAQRLLEASIPVTQRVYCPFPKCSALMSLSQGFDNVRPDEGRGGARRCVGCRELFCVNCRVAWHGGISCSGYRAQNPDTDALAKLKGLGDVRRWRQCGWCSHMIELDRGCNHVICRCGYAFCYVCGAERRMGNATCSCPAWAEENILY